MQVASRGAFLNLDFLSTDQNALELHAVLQQDLPTGQQYPAQSAVVQDLDVLEGDQGEHRIRTQQARTGPRCDLLDLDVVRGDDRPDARQGAPESGFTLHEHDVV